MSIPFEASRSFVYQATRYDLLPRIAEFAQEFGDKPFLLRDVTKRVLDETYTQEQLEIRVKKAQSDKMEKVRTIFGFYVPFLAENLHFFENVGGGYFRNISIADGLAEVDAVATDSESNDAGFIYAYTFPTIRKSDGRFPIKIGLTTTGDCEARVAHQCKQTCCFEYPVLLKTWDVQRVGALENAIHSALEARGYRRESPGAEWFDTTPEEIDAIIKFIQPFTKCASPK